MSHLKLLVVLLVGVPSPPTLNVVSVDGFIDESWQVLKGSLGVAVNRPAHQCTQTLQEHYQCMACKHPASAIMQCWYVMVHTVMQCRWHKNYIVLHVAFVYITCISTIETWQCNMLHEKAEHLQVAHEHGVDLQQRHKEGTHTGNKVRICVHVAGGFAAAHLN